MWAVWGKAAAQTRPSGMVFPVCADALSHHAPGPPAHSPALAAPQVETEDRFEWIGGSSIGGGTFWGLGALLTKTKVSQRWLCSKSVSQTSQERVGGHEPRGWRWRGGWGSGSSPGLILAVFLGCPRTAVRLSEPPVSPGVGGGGRPRSPAYLLPASVPGGGRASGRASGPRPPRTAPRAEGMPAAHALASAPSPQKFDELLHLASKGQHANVDMLVQDVYGGAHQTLGLSGNLIASSFGKSATADRGTCPPRPPRAGGPAPGLARQRLPVPAEFCKEDMAKSLLHMISNDIGQLACLHARLHRLDRVYFGGFFIRGHPVTMRTITYSINFFSKVTELRPPPRPRLLCPQRSSRVLARGARQGRFGAGGRGARGAPASSSRAPAPFVWWLQRPAPGRRGRPGVGHDASREHAAGGLPHGRAEL